MNSVPVLPKGRFWEMISFEFHLKNRHEKTRNRKISVIWCISAEMLCQFFDMFLRLCVVFLKPLTSRIIVFYAEHNPYGLQSPIVSSLAFGAFGSATKVNRSLPYDFSSSSKAASISIVTTFNSHQGIVHNLPVVLGCNTAIVNHSAKLTGIIG